MLKIRLKKYGRKNQPSYRIIIIDSKKRRNGRPIEEIGFYSPLKAITTLNIQKAEYYLRQGAKPSKIVQSIWKKIQIS